MYSYLDLRDRKGALDLSLPACVSFQPPIDNTDRTYLENTHTHAHIYRITHMHIPLALGCDPGVSALERWRLLLQDGWWLQLRTAVVLTAVGVSPYFQGRGDLDTSVRVNTPTLAPLSMGGHVTLFKVILSCLVTVWKIQVIQILQRPFIVMESHPGDLLQHSI